MLQPCPLNLHVLAQLEGELEVTLGDPLMEELTLASHSGLAPLHLEGAVFGLQLQLVALEASHGNRDAVAVMLPLLDVVRGIGCRLLVEQAFQLAGHPLEADGIGREVRKIEVTHNPILLISNRFDSPQARHRHPGNVKIAVSSGCQPLISILRGFIASGTSRARSMCSRPFLRSAPFTRT